MKALVTGAGGFVGGYLVDALLERDYNVRAMIRRKSDGAVPATLKRITDIVRADVTDYFDCHEAVEGCDYVFHLASQSFVPDSVKNPGYTFQVNALGTKNVLDACKQHGAKMVFASSSEVYGLQYEKELPINESNATRPQSPYASAKLFGENLCLNYAKNYGMRAVVSRAFNHEGPGRGHHFVTASIIRQLVMIKQGEKDRLVVGLVTPTRDWSHVEDICRAYILLAERGLSEIYVSGSGKETSVMEFIRLASEALGVTPHIVYDSSRTRPADVPRLRADPSKIKALGWSPELDLDDIITQMIAFYNGMSKEKRASIDNNMR